MITPQFRRLPLWLLGSVMVGLSPVPAVAQAGNDGSPDSRAISNADQLRELVRTGIVAYRKGDQESARAALVEALKLNPGPTVIATLADIEMKMGRYRDAAEHWTVYLNVAPQGDSKERTEAEEQLKLCLEYVGSVMVTVQPPDAVLWVDGAPFELAPTKGRLWLNSGLHTMQVKSQEQSSSEPKEYLIRKGENTPLTLTTQSAVSAAPTKPMVSAPTVNMSVASERDSSGMQPRTIALLGGGVLTLAAATIGTVYWVKNSNAKNDADALVKSLNHDSGSNTTSFFSACRSSNAPSECDSLKSKNDDMKRTANISDYSFVAAGVLGVATMGAYFVWPKSRTNAEAKSSLVVAPWWSPSNQGVAARVSF